MLFQLSSTAVMATAKLTAVWIRYLPSCREKEREVGKVRASVDEAGDERHGPRIVTPFT